MKARITVIALNQIDGSLHEVVANVLASTEQEAVDKLFDIAKEEIAYKYLGANGFITPTGQSFVTFPNYVGQWYVSE